MGKSKKNNAIGCVISGARISAVEVSFGATHQVLTKAEVRLPEGLIADGTITDIPEAAKLLGTLLHDNGFSNAPLIIGVKNDSVLLRMASFPKVPDDRLHNAVMLQAQQFIPVPIRELVLDFIVCGEDIEADRPMINTMLVGAKKVYIQHIIEMLAQAGCSLEDIDSALLATVRAALTLPLRKDRVYMIVDLDEEAVNIAFIQNEQILMTRSVGLATSFKQILNSNEALTDDDTQSMGTTLTADLRTSLLYFHNTKPGIELERILLTGTTEHLSELAAVLDEQLQISVEIPHYYPLLGGISAEEVRKYAACIGLAMRGWEE